MFPLYQPFQNEWITFALFFIGILLLLSITEFTREKFKWTVRTTRKVVHVLVGISILTSPFIFKSNYQPITLAIIFIIINYITLKSQKLKAIHATHRKTYGTVYFPIAYLILALFWWDNPITLEISLLILIFADTAAAIVGENSRSPEIYHGWKDEKTVQGSVIFFLMSMLIIGFSTTYLHKISGLTPPDIALLIPIIFLVAGITTLAEALSNAGSDNLSVPLVAAISYDLLIKSTNDNTILLLLGWIIFSFLIAYGAFRLRSLATDGSLGSFLMGIFIFGIGGWKFMIPLGIFFFLSSLISHLGGRKKMNEQASVTKDGNRDIVQVYANGGIPLLITIWWFYNPADWIYIAYIASVAAATADTWGTEIGYFSRKPPRNILSFKQLDRGASGGVTIIGTIGSFMGSFVIGISAYMFLPDPGLFTTIIAAGFLASIIDSILGATIQGIFTCSKCEKRVEKSEHCKEPAVLISGIKWINNDLVNVVCTLSGAAIYLLL